MAEQNSVVVPQIRPEQVMEQLGIRKDAYYADLKFLGIQAQRDSDGKSYLDEVQFQLLVALRKHVVETGKREGFEAPGEMVAIAEDTLAGPEAHPQPREEATEFRNQIDDLIRAAAELKGEQLLTPQLIIQELADRMTYEDLPADVKARIEAAKRPQVEPGKIAGQLLSQWRQQRAATAA